MATSTSNVLLHASLSNSPHSQGPARRPLSTSETSPTPDSREHIPMTITTSPHLKSISETLLKLPVNSNTSTIPMSKFVFKVETTPPTVIVYMGMTECINPTKLVITTTYPTTTCMTQTQVSLTSSYTTTPVTGKPWTTITSTYPVTTTKRVTSAVTNSPSTTTPGKSPTTMTPTPSLVPTTHTTLDTQISSVAEHRSGPDYNNKHHLTLPFEHHNPYYQGYNYPSISSYYCDHDQNRNNDSNQHFNTCLLENSITHHLNNKNNQDCHGNHPGCYHTPGNHDHANNTQKLSSHQLFIHLHDREHNHICIPVIPPCLCYGADNHNYTSILREYCSPYRDSSHHRVHILDHGNHPGCYHTPGNHDHANNTQKLSSHQLFIHLHDREHNHICIPVIPPCLCYGADNHNYTSILREYCSPYRDSSHHRVHILDHGNHPGCYHTPGNHDHANNTQKLSSHQLFIHLHDREHNHICIPVIPPCLCYGADNHNYTSILREYCSPYRDSSHHRVHILDHGNHPGCYHTPGNHDHANNTQKLSSHQLFIHLHDREHNHICIPVIPPCLCYGADNHNYTSILREYCSPYRDSSHHRVHILDHGNHPGCYHTPGNHDHANNTQKLSSHQLFIHLHDREHNHICIPVIPPCLCYGADNHNYTSILREYCSPYRDSSHHRVHILDHGNHPGCYHTPGNHDHANNTQKLSSHQLFIHLHDREHNHICIPVIPPCLCYGADNHNYTSILREYCSPYRDSSHHRVHILDHGNHPGCYHTPGNHDHANNTQKLSSHQLFIHLHDREHNHICIPVIPPCLCYGADNHNYTSILREYCSPYRDSSHHRVHILDHGNHPGCYHTPGNHDHANNTQKLSSHQLFIHLHDREHNHICIPVIPPCLCYGADNHNYTSILREYCSPYRDSSHHRVHILEYHCHFAHSSLNHRSSQVWDHKRGTCDNGGTWMQSHCSCPSTFSGSRCEFAVEHIDLDKVDTEVGMEVSVNKEFSPDLNDNTSKAYKDFTDTFRDQMKKVYQNVKGFKDVVILSLRSGSIVVDYLVQLELPFSLQLESEYEKVKVALKEELQNVSQDNSCEKDQVLCFKPDSIKVNNTTRTELSPEAICRNAAAVGYEDFYFPLLKENKLRCVTKCTAGVDGAINCRQGQCVLQSRGPYCRCFSTDTHWFSGPRCEVAISWKALVGGLAGTAALLLLLLLGALSVFVARSWRKRGQGGGLSWDDRKWFETCDENTVKTFSNSGFENDSTYENFHVALENVDTNMMVRGQGQGPGRDKEVLTF
ncbi:PREDICTED: uncharacterized protein LOC103087149 [Lipotes vexillifer]|uniref:Uncharacterized protein LOC103087149 n=1 Tax=Lipotes vexillifer TaxID=118797 RepID=A0A340Y941_LIPVE|nr:PREDICTED: uncharacterized protein LOC103087149 [Lipotes vexillifer]